MFQATVRQAFRGREDDAVVTRDFKVGDVIKGELALAMVAAGYARPLKGDLEGKKAKQSPRNKARTAAPRNKSIS